MRFDRNRRFRFAARVAGCKIRRKSEQFIPGRAGDAKFGCMWSFVAGWAGATACGGRRRSILGQAEVRHPEELQARRGSAGEVTGSGSEASASTAPVEDKTAELKLRVTSPVWLKRRRSIESGDFVHESRARTEEPKDIASWNKGLAGGGFRSPENGDPASDSGRW